MYQYILFDLDGTLTDPKEGITKSVQHALRHFGQEVADLDSLCKYIGPPLGESFMRFGGIAQDEVDAAIAKYREYFGVKGIYENKLYDRVPETLQALKSVGCKVILATSKPTVYAVKILKHFGIFDLFDVVAGSELSGERVKKAEVIEYALANAGITDRAAAVMIGDREHDILGAKQIGLACVGVLHGYGGREELESAGADVILEDVKAVRTWLLEAERSAKCK